MYAQPDATWKDIYRQLVVSWSMLQIPEGLTLTWMIERAANTNVTCVTTTTDVVTKMQLFDVDLLIRKDLPRENFRQAMIQARDLLRNPFCSVVQPTVNIQT